MLVTAAVTALLLLAPSAAARRRRRRRTRAVSVAATTAGTWGALVPVVDRLDDGDVLAITVTDGVARSEGIVRQCTQTATGFDDCTNRFPVQFGDDGRARFQYRVADPGTCDGTAACVVVVGDAGGDRQAVVATVFGGAAPPPPTAELASPGPYEPGQEVAVAVSDLRAGADVSAAFCAEIVRRAEARRRRRRTARRRSRSPSATVAAAAAWSWSAARARRGSGSRSCRPRPSATT